MIRLPEAIASVMLGTLAAGAAGGLTGFAIGKLAPSFVRWLCGPGAVGDVAEIAFGLGIVSGLVMGAGVSMFLAAVIIIREAFVARAEIRDQRTTRVGFEESGSR
jgi:hypothetical protein